MGTKTKPNSHIETILHDAENGHADEHNDDVMDDYETDQAGEIADVEEPTPVTTAAEEFPAVIQAGMWVRLTQYVEIENGDGSTRVFEEGLFGQVVVDESVDGKGFCAVNLVIDDANKEVDYGYFLPLGIHPGDPLPSYMEQINAPEPATLPDSTPLDDLDGENIEPSEAETVYTTTMTVTEPSAEYVEKNSGPIYFRFKPDEIIAIPTGARVLEFRILKVSNLGLDIIAAEQVYREPAPIDEPVNPGNPYEVIDYLAKLAKRANEINNEHEDVSELKKLIKKRLDKASDQLRIATLAQAEPELFHQRELASEGGMAGDIAGAELDAAADKLLQSPAAPDESWRSVSIDVLNLPGKIPEQLRAHSWPMETIGDISDFTSNRYRNLTDVKGIGAGKVEKIEDALMAFWAANPQYVGHLMPVTMTAEPAKVTDAPDPTSTEQGAAAFDSGMTIWDNPHPRGSSDWDEWRAGFKERGGMGDRDEAVGDEDL